MHKQIQTYSHSEGNFTQVGDAPDPDQEVSGSCRPPHSTPLLPPDHTAFPQCLQASDSVALSPPGRQLSDCLQHSLCEKDVAHWNPVYACAPTCACTHAYTHNITKSAMCPDISYFILPTSQPLSKAAHNLSTQFYDPLMGHNPQFEKHDLGPIRIIR